MTAIKEILEKTDFTEIKTSLGNPVRSGYQMKTEQCIGVIKMRGAKIVLFLICVITVSTQTFRHIYVKFLDKNESILDKYRTDIEVSIYESTDMDQLEQLYIENDSKIKEIENTIEKYEEDRDYKQLQAEKRKITSAINRAERLSESTYKLMIYWTMGFFCVVFGCVSYFFTSKWISLAALISGFSEMMVWTSPLFDRSNTLNFVELLNMKLVLSIITLILIVTLWLLNERFIEKSLKD